MTLLGRRTFIASTAAAGSLLALSCKTAMDEDKDNEGSHLSSSDSQRVNKLDPRIRRRWIPGEEADFKAKYIQAVTWLKANDGKTFAPEDPRSYLSWERFVKIHDTSCHHGDWYIFPWHRNFVNYFELACQVALDDPTFTLPYWDWTIDGHIPDEFYDVPVLTIDRSLKKGMVIPEEFVGEKVMTKILSDENFFSFFSKPVAKTKFERLVPRTGAFEAGPHNKVHNTIGTFMAGNTSPTDPIFWLHHSNVDRIYCQWMVNHPTSNIPYPTVEAEPTVVPAPSSETPSTSPVIRAAITTGHSNEEWNDEAMVLNWNKEVEGEEGGHEIEEQIQPAIVGKHRSLPSSMKVSELQSHVDLGYSYDTLPQATIKPPSHIAIIKKSRLLTNVTGKQTLSEKKLSQVITMTTALSTTVLGEFQKSKLNYASLVAYDLEAPTDKSVREGMSFRFFVLTGKPSESKLDFWAKDAFKHDAYVGSYTFLNSHHHHGATEEAPLSTEFDISVWLRHQLENGKISVIKLIAVAVDTRDAYSAVAAFSTSSKTSLALQFSLTGLS